MGGGGMWLAGCGQARRRAMVLAVERGLDDDRLKQRFFSLVSQEGTHTRS